MIILLINLALGIQSSHAACDVGSMQTSENKILVCDTQFSDIAKLVIVEAKDGTIQACEENIYSQASSFASFTQDSELGLSTLLSDWNGYSRTIMHHGSGNYTIQAKDECSASYSAVFCK